VAPSDQFGLRQVKTDLSLDSDRLGLGKARVGGQKRGTHAARPKTIVSYRYGRIEGAGELDGSM
jgi:hypothetical protein